MKVFNCLWLFAFITITGFSSCKKKCYECVKKCGACTKGSQSVSGCEGDSYLQGQSIDTWKIWLEADGWTCAYNNIVEDDVCGAEDKKTFENQFYVCKSQ